MGLIERGTSPLDEASKDSSSFRSSRRLPWFVARTGGILLSLSALTGVNPSEFNPLSLSSRTVLAQSAVSADIADVVDINEQVLSLGNKEQLFSDQVTKLYIAAIPLLGDSFNITGQPLTRIFSDQKLYSNMELLLDPDGQLKVSNLLTQLDNTPGWNSELIAPFISDPIPPRGIFETEISQEIQDKVLKLAQLLNLKLEITAAKNYGWRSVFRIEDMFALVDEKLEDGTRNIRLADAGLQALAARLIPQQFILGPTEVATGGGTTPTPEQTAQLTTELSIYQINIDTLGGKAKYHVIGDKTNLTLSDSVLYNQIFGPLVEQYRPNGIEFFFYTDRFEPNSLGWTDSQGFTKLEQRLRNVQDDIAYSAGFTNSFLKDTNVLVGIRPEDGVTEVHMGLYPKEGANPTSEDIREHSFMLSSDLVYKTIDIKPDTNNPDLRQALLALVERRVRGNLPFPFTISPA